MRKYLDKHLADPQLPHRKIFRHLNNDGDERLSKAEFELREDAIRHFLGEDYFESDGTEDIVDPGEDYVPFRGLDQAMNDEATYGALYHRYYEVIENKDRDWPQPKLSAIPKRSEIDLASIEQSPQKSSVEDLVDATLMLAGGNDHFFNGGAVVISTDGLALTNHHIAKEMRRSKLVTMNSRGRRHRVIELIAADKERDIALVRLEGKNFKPVKIASAAPKMGDDLVMIHHSENRFYTYDRGYVMRHPILGGHQWMEVSADYAPGGSGCGIFNQKHELVGLVCLIQYGDGPWLAKGFDTTGNGDSSTQDDSTFLLVKHAVPLSAIKSLFSVDVD